MLKMIALFQFEPGLAREDAIHYHEMRHVPLICKLLPDIFLNYRRSYPDPGTTFSGSHKRRSAANAIVRRDERTLDGGPGGIRGR